MDWASDEWRNKHHSAFTTPKEDVYTGDEEDSVSDDDPRAQGYLRLKDHSSDSEVRLVHEILHHGSSFIGGSQNPTRVKSDVSLRSSTKLSLLAYHLLHASFCCVMILMKMLAHSRNQMRIDLSLPVSIH